MEKIPDEMKIKIIEKMRGMVYVRSLEKLEPKITIPEFKFIIASIKLKGNSIFRLKKENWYDLAIELEKENVIRLYRNYKGMKVLGSNVKA